MRTVCIIALALVAAVVADIDTDWDGKFEEPKKDTCSCECDCEPEVNVMQGCDSCIKNRIGFTPLKSTPAISDHCTEEYEFPGTMNAFECEVFGNWCDGWALEIYATPTDGASPIDKMAFNLETAFGDIGFHFDLRFNFDGHVEMIVVNMKINGTWGTEIDVFPSPWPFAVDVQFTMVFEVHESSYVALLLLDSGKAEVLYEFENDMPARSDIDRICLWDHGTIDNIIIHQDWERPDPPTASPTVP